MTDTHTIEKKGSSLFKTGEKILKMAWYRRKTRKKMERVFSRRPDPFHYESSPYERHRLEALLQSAQPGKELFDWGLEVGCAEGSLTHALAGQCRHLVAVDISPTAIQRARARCPATVLFIESEFFSFLPQRTGAGTFDLVVFGDVLYYLDKPASRDEFLALFPRVKSWLSPKARVILAHGFTSEKEYRHRLGFREKFEEAGLHLDRETILKDPSKPLVSCLLSVLSNPL
ncbi:MAG: methyltransferase domain-containing protein [Elusimicrobia bacterium]|nr:methyltransferase domain-containing protein [Elusimicrobiota bacterium]